VLADDLFDDDYGIMPILIPSESSRLGSQLPASVDEFTDVVKAGVNIVDCHLLEVSVSKHMIKD
jgi:hypothetical protein